MIWDKFITPSKKHSEAGCSKQPVYEMTKEKGEKPVLKVTSHREVQEEIDSYLPLCSLAKQKEMAILNGRSLALNENNMFIDCTKYGHDQVERQMMVDAAEKGDKVALLKMMLAEEEAKQKQNIPTKDGTPNVIKQEQDKPLENKEELKA